jgi:hypothetical protein
LNGLAPGYIDHLIVRHVPGQRLRSADQGLLSVPRTRTKRYGSHAFKLVAPGLECTAGYDQGADRRLVF